MQVAKKKRHSDYPVWFYRKQPGKRPTMPWFVLPLFNNAHPLEILKARVRHWDSLDKQHPQTRPSDLDQIERGLQSLPDDLRWLASRLEILLEQGYTPSAD